MKPLLGQLARQTGLPQGEMSVARLLLAAKRLVAPGRYDAVAVVRLLAAVDEYEMCHDPRTRTPAASRHKRLDRSGAAALPDAVSMTHDRG